MRKTITLIIFGVTVIMLSACSIIMNPPQALNSHKTLINNHIETPPILRVSNGNKQIEAMIGTQEWTVKYSDGTFWEVKAKSDIPPRLIQHEKHEVNLNITSKSVIEFIFEKQPIVYVIREWDNNGDVIAEYRNEQDLTNLQGSHIIEVFATFDQGTVSYAFSINNEN